MSSASLVTPRHARLAVAGYAASLLAVVAMGSMLLLSNRELQGEYEAKMQLLDGLRQTDAAGVAKAGASAAHAAAILAPTETIAASALQKQILDRLAEAGGSVQSAQAEPTRQAPVDGLQQLIAKLTFESSLPAFQRLLFELETGFPVMFVESVSAQPAITPTAGMQADDRLRVTLVVSGWWKRSEAGKRVP